MDIGTPGDRERLPCGIREAREKRTELGRGGHRQVRRAHSRGHAPGEARSTAGTTGSAPSGWTASGAASSWLPETGDTYCLITVLPHDKANAYASQSPVQRQPGARRPGSPRRGSSCSNCSRPCKQCPARRQAAVRRCQRRRPDPARASTPRSSRSSGCSAPTRTWRRCRPCCRTPSTPRFTRWLAG